MDPTKMAEVLERIEGNVKKGLDAQTEHGKKLDALDARVVTIETERKSRVVSVPGVNEEKQKFSFARAYRGILFDDWSESGFEKEVFAETKKRALSAGVDSKGGYLVPAEIMAEQIELLRAELVLAKLGARVFPNLGGSPVEINKLSGGATGYWVGENPTTITDSDPTLGQVSLTPKLAATLVKVSRRQLLLAPGTEALVNEDMREVMQLLVDLAGLRGTGSSHQPLGVVNWPGINTVAIAATGGEITYDHLIDMEGELDDDNALKGTLGFVSHPKIRRKLRKLKGTDGHPLIHWDRSAVQAAGGVVVPRASLMEYPYFTSTQLPTTLTKSSGTNLAELIFGNWRDLVMGIWASLTLEASDQAGTSFAQHQRWLKATMEVDFAVRHPESFCLINDAETV